MTEEPKRLLLTEEGRLAAGLAVARRQGPSEAQLAGLAERLAQAGIALPDDIVRGAASPTARATTTHGPRRLAKLMMFGGVPIVGLALIAAWLYGTKPPAAPGDAAPLAPLAPLAVAPPAPEAAAPTTESRGTAPSPRPTSPTAAPSASQEAADGTARTEPEAAANAKLEAPANEARPRSPTALRAEQKPPSTATAANAPAAAPARSAALTGPQRSGAISDSEGSASGEATIETEIELLKHARNTLPADPARALAITEECARLYPRGAFTQERDFIAISALFRVGRRHEALSRAERFRSAYPKSVYLPQLERMQAAP